MSKVEIKVDMIRRNKLRKLHSATHVMNYASKCILGNHIWQNGSNLKEEIGTLDITHYDSLTLDEIFKIERLANELVVEDKKIYVEEIDRNLAEEKFGFTIYQGGAIPMKKLRIVRVGDEDIEACGGIHVGSTGGIGYIKIVDSQKIQDGVVRLKYVVGNFAADFIEEIQSRDKKLCEVFSVGSNQLIKTSEKFFNEWKERGKEIEKLKQTIKETNISMIQSSDKIEFELNGLDMGELVEIFTKVLLDKKKLWIESEKFILTTKNFEVKDFKKEINKGDFSIFIK